MVDWKTKVTSTAGIFLWNGLKNRKFYFHWQNFTGTEQILHAVEDVKPRALFQKLDTFAINYWTSLWLHWNVPYLSLIYYISNEAQLLPDLNLPKIGRSSKNHLKKGFSCTVPSISYPLCFSWAEWAIPEKVCPPPPPPEGWKVGFPDFLFFFCFVFWPKSLFSHRFQKKINTGASNPDIFIFSVWISREKL